MNESDLPTTTRRHPRTLAEAFPFGPEYGCAIDGPYRRPLSFRLWPLVGTFVGGLMLVGVML